MPPVRRSATAVGAPAGANWGWSDVQQLDAHPYAPPHHEAARGGVDSMRDMQLVSKQEAEAAGIYGRRARRYEVEQQSGRGKVRANPAANRALRDMQFVSRQEAEAAGIYGRRARRFEVEQKKHGARRRAH